jgi:hypothetical protein
MNRIRFAHRSSSQRTLSLIAKALAGVSRTGPVAVLRLALLILGAASVNAGAQTHEWTWMGGSSIDGYTALCRTFGTPAPRNVPGSPVTHPPGLTLVVPSGFSVATLLRTPTDALFILDGLWKFNPSTNAID